MKFKLKLGTFHYTANINVPRGVEGFPQLPPRMVELQITRIDGHNVWGELIQNPSSNSRRIITQLTGFQTEDGVLRLQSNAFSRNSKNEVVDPYGSNIPGAFGLSTTITMLKYDNYEIACVRPGVVSETNKSIGTFTESKSKLKSKSKSTSKSKSKSKSKVKSSSSW